MNTLNPRPFAASSTSRAEDGIVPRLFAYSAPPAQILDAAAVGLRRRHLAILSTHRAVLQELGCLNQLEHPELLDSPAALFELVHSPFEYALHLFEENGFRRDVDALHIAHHVNAIVDRARDAARDGWHASNTYRLYEILPGSASSSFFPSPRIHNPLTDGTTFDRYRTLIDGARTLVAKWNLALAVEVDLFIGEYALSDADFYNLAYLSVDGVPGHVRLAPLRLLDGEANRYEPGSILEAALMAAQLVHESRHQKGFFFNRFTDPRPILYPSGFVQADCQRQGLPAPFHHHVVQEIFDLLLSLSYELSFLRYLMETESFGEWRDAWVSKIKLKKRFVLMLVLEAERNRGRFTPLGRATLDAVLSFLES